MLEINKAIADKLKEIRVNILNLRQEDIATLLDMEVSAYARYESNRARIPFDKLIQLSIKLKINILEEFHCIIEDPMYIEDRVKITEENLEVNRMRNNLREEIKRKRNHEELLQELKAMRNRDTVDPYGD